MRSFSSAPSLQQRPKPNDVGYINMKKQSSLEEGCIPEDIHGEDSGENAFLSSSSLSFFLDFNAVCSKILHSASACVSIDKFSVKYCI